MFRHLRRTSGALLISLAIHIIFVIVIGVKMMNSGKEQKTDKYLTVDWVKAPPPEFKQTREPLFVKRIKKKFNIERTVEGRKTDSEVGPSVVKQKAQTVKESSEPIKTNVQLSSKRESSLARGLTTEADVESLGDYKLAVSGSYSSRDASTGRGIPAINQIRTESRGRKSSGIESLLDSTGTGDLEGGVGDIAELIKVPDNKLGAVLVGEGPDVSGFIRFVRLKHSLSDWWQDPSALPSLFTWLEEHTRLRADMDIKEGALKFSDQKIFDAPLVVMTGHDQGVVKSRNLAGGRQDKFVPDTVKKYKLKDSFSDEERIALRKYIIDYGGTLFFDDCGFNGTFAAKVKHELERVFPEYPLVDIPHDDELYNIYYHLSGPPTGGDVFWGSENNPHASPFKYQKGVKIDGRWAVVYNRKDYMCAMETMEIPSRTRLRMRRSTDVHRFMTNLFVYVMKYGGNVDRSSYTPY